MRVDESNFETLKKTMDITLVDYEINWYDAENIKGHIESDELLSIIDDLIVEYHVLEEKLEEQKEYCNQYHTDKKIDPYDEYGLNPNDFH